MNSNKIFIKFTFSRRHVGALLAFVIALSIFIGGVKPSYGLNFCPHPLSSSNNKANIIKQNKTRTIELAQNMQKPSKSSSNWQDSIIKIAQNGTVLLVDPQKNDAQAELFSYNADKNYIPASVLKIFTASVALEKLGEKYHFKTELSLSHPGPDLWIIGHGDPTLTSEEIGKIAKELKRKKITEIRNINIDSSYFSPDLILTGTQQTLNPYDAFTGALCVNFNTIVCKIDQNKNISPGEEQTPLTPLAIKLALQSGKKGLVRFNISENPTQTRLYSGELFQAFLENENIKISGKINTDQVAPKNKKIIYIHQSSKNISEIIATLMEYSNNFMTNQIFLTIGAEHYGAPANLEKSIKVYKDFLIKHQIPLFNFDEGSGLSRNNRLNARQLSQILGTFEEHRHLLSSNKDKGIWFKTGTMNNVKSLAGYIERPKERPLYFVIMLNGAHGIGDREKILTILKENFNNF